MLNFIRKSSAARTRAARDDESGVSYGAGRRRNPPEPRDELLMVAEIKLIYALFAADHVLRSVFALAASRRRICPNLRIARLFSAKIKRHNF